MQCLLKFEETDSLPYLTTVFQPWRLHNVGYDVTMLMKTEYFPESSHILFESS